jgi:hypothetical protein
MKSVSEELWERCFIHGRWNGEMGRWMGLVYVPTMTYFVMSRYEAMIAIPGSVRRDQEEDLKKEALKRFRKGRIPMHAVVEISALTRRPCRHHFMGPS